MMEPGDFQVCDKLSRQEAIPVMNCLGNAGIPFLFLVDFEMKAIRIFRLDCLPADVSYTFRGQGAPDIRRRNSRPFAFRKFPVSFAAYSKAFKTIQKHIQAGNTFLANLTFPTPVETCMTLREIYEGSTSRYKILVENEFVCFSPETFITIRNGTISTFPMKGTRKVVSGESEGRLLDDNKEIAEHNTVVDLLRNDLSMVATRVQVNRFRYMEHIQTHEGELLQVSSEITGELPASWHGRVGEILFAMLPAGSVTGAPKSRTLTVIREAEKADRGYYTGVCGVFNGHALDSAVLIRFIEKHDGMMHFRSGGGITCMSEARAEYDEMKDKVYVPVA